MRRLALALALLLPLTACPEQRPPPARQRPPPQGALAAGAGAVDVLTVARPAEPEWFGLYLVGKKAGWSRAELRREIRDGRDVLVGRGETLIRATVGGREVERRHEEERVYEARPGGRLLSFRAAWAGDGGARTVQGGCEGGTCKAVLESGGAREERTIEGVRDTADLADGVRLAAAHRSSVSGGQLDLEKLRVRDVQDVFLRRERIAGAGVQEEVSVVAESEAGDRMAAEYKVADDGRVVEIRLGEAIVARPEPEAAAKRLDTIDLFALARVALPAPLPREVPKSVVYRLSGLPAAFQKNDARQRFERAKGGTTVLTVTARRPAAADPARDTPLAKAAAGAAADDLASTPQANADDPGDPPPRRPGGGRRPRRVRGGAPPVRSRPPHPREGVRREPRPRERRARRGQGRLHRARGAPRGPRARARASRRAASTASSTREYDDGQPALYWHAWAEVRSGGEWIAMDPTFGQPVADATHVALGAGTQVDTIGLLGALKVLGVEAKDPK